MSVVTPGSGSKPVFGFVLFGGAVTGAFLRECRLANELHMRGFPVHVWWAVDRPHASPLHPGIDQHWLFSCVRYARPRLPGLFGLKDHLARFISWHLPDRLCSRLYQRFPPLVDGCMISLIRCLCGDLEKDPGILRSLARQLARHRVTHVFPMLSLLAPWVLEARKLMDHPPKLLITFQGYEVVANYARPAGLEPSFLTRTREAVLASDLPAVCVSDDYAGRVAVDLDLSPQALHVIPPGVCAPVPIDRPQARLVLAGYFPDFSPGLPLVTYFGRLDAEKGVDLLLYAADIVRSRSVPFQVAVCGPTLHSVSYARSCRLVAENLRLPVLWHDGDVPEELRDALLAGSDVVVYPSIYREPFGMVPVEAMSYGTPALVPDQGGVREVIGLDGRVGGLTFRFADSGDLADQLHRLLIDRDLWTRLSADGPAVASNYYVPRMTDRVLTHIGLPLRPVSSADSADYAD